MGIRPRIATEQHGLGEERGQLTSRSGVLQPAWSRVVSGENANGGGGLAEQSAISQRCCMGDSFWASNGFVPTRAGRASGAPRQEQLQALSSKLQGKALLSPRNNTD